MAFQVPASKKSIAQNRFEFELDGKTYSIPLMQYVSVEAAEAFEAGKPVAAILAACGGDEARAAVRGLDSDQLDALMRAWDEASEVKPGESPAS